MPVVRSPEGIRAALGNPAQVEKYLIGKFGADLEAARAAMEGLALAYDPADLNRRSFRFYELFRPGVPAGGSVRGALAKLDLAKPRDAAS